MFEVGIASWTCETDGTVDALQRIARHGFRNVELWCNYAHLDPRLGDEVARVQEALTREGLRAVSLHAPYEFRGRELSNDTAWVAWERLMVPVLEAAERLQVRFVVVHPVLLWFSSGPSQDEPGVTGCRQESLRRVARLAGRKGIRIALENLLRKTAPAFADLRELVRLTRRLGEDNVGICLDTGHCLASGLDPLREIDQCASELCSFHLHENDGVEDLHWVPGRGRIDWSRFFDKLGSLDYGGACILEIWGGNDAEAVMNEAWRFAKGIPCGESPRSRQGPTNSDWDDDRQ
ncbi:MAG: sugar phosphate isomerase/epimerase family protein [Candidatus Methylomirabilales bacterium]